MRGWTRGPAAPSEMRSARRTRGDDVSEAVDPRGGGAARGAVQSAGRDARRDAQDVSLATYAPMLTKEHGRIDWSGRRWSAQPGRGMTPWPCGVRAHATEDAQVLSSAVAGESRARGAGEVVALGRDGIAVACGKGSSAFGSAARRGKAMDAWAYAQGGGWRRGSGYRKDAAISVLARVDATRPRRHRARPPRCARRFFRFPRPGAPDRARDGNLAPARHDRLRPSAVPLPSLEQTDAYVRKPSGWGVPALLHPHPRPRGR